MGTVSSAVLKYHPRAPDLVSESSVVAMKKICERNWAQQKEEVTGEASAYGGEYESHLHPLLCTRPPTNWPSVSSCDGFEGISSRKFELSLASAPVFVVWDDTKLL